METALFHPPPPTIELSLWSLTRASCCRAGSQVEQSTERLVKSSHVLGCLLGFWRTHIISLTKQLRHRLFKALLFCHVPPVQACPSSGDQSASLGLEGPDSQSCRNPRSLPQTLGGLSLGFEVGTALIAFGRNHTSLIQPCSPVGGSAVGSRFRF